MPLTKHHWYYLPINPVPWEVGPLGVGRRNGKAFPTIGRSQNLYAFQQEVKEFFPEGIKVPMLDGPVEVFFWFWQQLEVYHTPRGRKQTKKAADATNMQKATEDALQGILFDNDRDNRRVGSEIVEQGTDVTPGIAIKVCSYVSNSDIELPFSVLEERSRQGDNTPRIQSDNNTWPPKGGF